MTVPPQTTKKQKHNDSTNKHNKSKQRSVVKGIGKSKPQIATEEPIHLTTELVLFFCFCCTVIVFLVFGLIFGTAIVCLGCFVFMFGECPRVFCCFWFVHHVW